MAGNSPNAELNHISSSIDAKDVKPIVTFSVDFKDLALKTVALPFFAMVFCFCWAMAFQFHEVVDVESCRGVQNFIPSISAITSAKPGAYVWRISIALHAGPRLVICSAYFYFYLRSMKNIPLDYRDLYKKVVTVTYWLTVVENFSLIGVTYISNLDHYPTHEKLFITFMVSSVTYMILTLLLLNFSHSKSPWTTQELLSFRTKFVLLSIICVLTVGMSYFFYLHRMYCTPRVFSYFAICEYCICMANMCFHASSYMEFPGQKLMLAQFLGEDNEEIKEKHS